MITEIVEAWDKRKDYIKSTLEELIENLDFDFEYISLAKIVFTELLHGGIYINPEVVHEIDDGHYQGSKLILCAIGDYQPSSYYYVFMSYGSCNVCDTMQGIQDEDNKDEQVKQLMMLALHIIQQMKEISHDYYYYYDN